MKVSSSFWLSLDLSSPKGTLAIHQWSSPNKPVLLHSQTVTTTGNHSESFIPTLESALKKNRLSIANLSKLITSPGPGSFTGLRIAFASLKAIAYQQRIPIEVISGSEARGLSWAKEQPSLPYDEIYVITLITADRFVSAKLVKHPSHVLELVEEKSFSNWSFIDFTKSTAIILDSRTEKNQIPSGSMVSVFSQDLEAKLLGDALLTAKTRKTYDTVEDWVGLVPNYFGSGKY